jgi:hypothetical protein
MLQTSQAHSELVKLGGPCPEQQRSYHLSLEDLRSTLISESVCEARVLGSLPMAGPVRCVEDACDPDEMLAMQCIQDRARLQTHSVPCINFSAVSACA